MKHLFSVSTKPAAGQGARTWRRRDYRLEFHIDDVKRADIEGVALQRVGVTGVAVKFADAG
jgi:hypothetical protein